MKVIQYLLLILLLFGPTFSQADPFDDDDEGEECTPETCVGLLATVSKGLREKEIEQGILSFTYKVDSRIAYEFGMALLRRGQHTDKAIDYVVFAIDLNPKLLPTFYQEVNGVSLDEDQLYWNHINQVVTAQLKER